MATSSDREQEFLLLSELYTQGIKVPQPLYFSRQPNFLNSDFFIMQKISGITDGRQLVRIAEQTQQNRILASIAQHLAKIHQIKQNPNLEKFLIKPPKDSYLENCLTDFLTQIDQLKRHQPVLEYAIRWMKNHLPQVEDLVLI